MNIVYVPLPHLRSVGSSPPFYNVFPTAVFKHVIRWMSFYLFVTDFNFVRLENHILSIIQLVSCLIYLIYEIKAQ